MSYGLTEREYELVRAIQDSIDLYGFTPSYQQLCDALGVQARSTVHRLVGQLASKGWVKRLPRRSRSVQLLRRLEGRSSKVAALATALRMARPSSDGMVTLVIPEATARETAAILEGMRS